MLRIFAIFALLIILQGARPLYPQVDPEPRSVCRSFDEGAEDLVEWVQMLVTDMTEEGIEDRERYRIPAVDASSVSYVTDETICRRAAIKYQHELDERGRPSRQVYVVQVATERKELRYIVIDPTYRAGEFQLWMVFDWRFKRLAAFAG